MLRGGYAQQARQLIEPCSTATKMRGFLIPLLGGLGRGVANVSSQARNRTAGIKPISIQLTASPAPRQRREEGPCLITNLLLPVWPKCDVGNGGRHPDAAGAWALPKRLFGFALKVQRLIQASLA